jgi:beta-lactamase class A
MSCGHAPIRHVALIVGLVLCVGTATAAPDFIETARAQPVRAQPPAAAAAQADAGAQAGSAAAICASESRKRRALAGRMSRGISAALRGRASIVGLTAADPAKGITCELHQGWHFHSASIVKVIILGALLRELRTKHRDLTAKQVFLTKEMITESSNSAATRLWDEVGMRNLQHFLDLAKMTHTRLGRDGFWGLTLVTAHDELILLKQLTSSNSVLDQPSRAYALKLMAEVIPSQRWGVPIGAPTDVTVHVKNGWLPDPVLWVINSIGAFTGHHRDYRIVVLTRGNRSMSYGIDTIQAVAKVINRDLNPGVKAVIAPSAPFPSWGTPDEQIPPPASRP